MYEKAFPSRAYLVLVLRSKKTDALRLTLDPQPPIRESLGGSRIRRGANATRLVGEG